MGLSGQVFHAPFLQANPGFRLAAVWERTKNIAAGKYPGVTTCRSLDELLADASVELVIVNTPNATHFDYASKALEAGKHVIVEKPFTVTVAEAERLAKLAQEKGRLLSVFQNRRWDSDFLTVRQVLREGRLGQIVEAELRFDRFKLSLSPKQHKESPNPGAGVLLDLGPHIIDQALVLFGLPNAVFADLRSLRPGTQVEDYFELLLFYPQLRVRLHSSYIAKDPGPAYILHGSKGSFVKSRADLQEAELQAGRRPDAEGWGTEPASEQGMLTLDDEGRRQPVPTLRGDYGRYFSAIASALRQGRPNPVPAEEGIAVMRVIEAARESAAERKVIDL